MGRNHPNPQRDSRPPRQRRWGPGSRGEGEPHSSAGASPGGCGLSPRRRTRRCHRAGDAPPQSLPVCWPQVTVGTRRAPHPVPALLTGPRPTAGLCQAASLPNTPPAHAEASEDVFSQPPRPVPYKRPNKPSAVLPAPPSRPAPKRGGCPQRCPSWGVSLNV